jgi:hypothetical protein
VLCGTRWCLLDDAQCQWCSFGGAKAFLSTLRPPWRGKWRAKGRRGGSSLGSLGASDAVVLGAQLLPRWKFGACFKACYVIDGIGGWCERCCREAGVVVDASAARVNFLGLRLMSWGGRGGRRHFLLSGHGSSWGATTVFWWLGLAVAVLSIPSLRCAFYC